MRFGTISGPTEWLILSVLGLIFTVFALVFIGRGWNLRKKSPLRALISIALGILVLIIGYWSAKLLYD